MTQTIAMTLFSVSFPSLIIMLRRESRFLRKFNPLILCYGIGILIGNTTTLPKEIIGIVEIMAMITAILAIPLMLFSVDIRKWGRLAGRAGLSMVLASVSVLLMAFVGHLLFKGILPESWQVAGLAIGVYTGGTPNLAAIRTALNIDLNTYLAVHTADMLASALYILFVLTVAKPLLSKILPAYKPVKQDEQEENDIIVEDFPAAADLLQKNTFGPLLRNILLAVLIFGTGAGLSLLLPNVSQTLVVILTTTTLSLLASFAPKIRKTRYSFQIGEYLIYIFCLSAGALSNIRALLTATPRIMMFIAFILFGSFTLHILLAKLFKIDVDTLLITSTSAIYSPPFIPVVAASVKNRDLIGPGITTGLIGYAAGTYLGTLAAGIFKFI